MDDMNVNIQILENLVRQPDGQLNNLINKMRATAKNGFYIFIEEEINGENKLIEKLTNEEELLGFLIARFRIDGNQV